MRRFATFVALIGCLAFVAGCGGEGEESDNPVDNDVPTEDVKPGQPVDPATLMNGSGDKDDTGTGDTNPDDDTSATDQNDSLVEPDLNAPTNTGPTLEPPKPERIRLKVVVTVSSGDGE